MRRPTQRDVRNAIYIRISREIYSSRYLYTSTDLGSLTVNNDGVQLRGLSAEVITYPFKQIPRFRSDEKSGYFEIEYDKPGGVGVHRVRSGQAHKIYCEIAATVERLVKARTAKK